MTEAATADSHQPVTIDTTESGSSLEWFALSTRSRTEPLVSNMLMNKGYEVVLPTRLEQKNLSGRRKAVARPLFPGYLFCRFDKSERLPILITPGVLSIVGAGKEPTAVSDQEVAALARVLGSGLPVEECTYLEAGQSVDIVSGAFCGLRGVVITGAEQTRLVVSIELLRRSVTVRLSRDDVRPSSE